jgi:hypothetical protein
MLSFSISCLDVIKFHYFADTSERGDGGEREGDFLDNFSICRIPCHTAYFLELALKRFHPGDFP